MIKILRTAPFLCLAIGIAVFALQSSAQATQASPDSGVVDANGLTQHDVPETTATRVFRAWLDTFNSADEEKIKAFDDAYKPSTPLADMAWLRTATGGFTLVHIEASTATSVTGWVKENENFVDDHFEFTVSANEPTTLLKANIRIVPPARLPMPEALAVVTQYVDKAAIDDKFSGAVLIAQNGEILLQNAWGLADRKNRVPLSLDSQFRLGSLNKMFTAVAILQWVDAGKVSLDDTVGKFLTNYPNKEIASKVTIRQLLNHTGGTGDIFGPEFSAKRLSLRTHHDYVKLFGKRGPIHEPGTTWEYSNYGFVLVGAIIEKLSGMSYYDYVQRNVFLPSGMNDTASLPESQRVPKRAIGYTDDDGRLIPNTDTLPWRGMAAGGGYSTVGDMLRFAEALQSGKLISKSLLADATHSQSTWSYGYGFWTEREGSWEGFGHFGGAEGMNGRLRVIPTQGYVIVVLSNLDAPAANRVAKYIETRLPQLP